MELDFYKDNTFQLRPLAKNLIVGDVFHFEVNWIEEFSAEFPVVMYVTECTVANPEKTKSFAIAKEGCLSNFVHMTRFSEAYSSDRLRFRFKSFSFDRVTLGKIDLTVTCKVKFCLRDDVAKGTCGIGQCPENYAPGEYKT